MRWAGGRRETREWRRKEKRTRDGRTETSYEARRKGVSSAHLALCRPCYSDAENRKGLEVQQVITGGAGLIETDEQSETTEVGSELHPVRVR